MKEVARLLNEMRACGVVREWALFGATAQMRYTEPVATIDADVLIDLPDAGRIDLLGPVYEFCRSKNLPPEGEAVRVGAWPVQFVPVFDPLTREALETAESIDFDGEPIRVVSAVHLAAIALATGRAKDHARILALLESGRVGRPEIARLAERFGLSAAWARFERRFLDD